MSVSNNIPCYYHNVFNEDQSTRRKVITIEEKNGTLQKLRQLRQMYFVKHTIMDSKHCLKFSDQRQALATSLPLAAIR